MFIPSNDLIVPEVIRVGGGTKVHGFDLPSTNLFTGKALSTSDDHSKRTSFLSDTSSSPTLEDSRGRQSSVCSSSGTLRSTYVAEWSPADNEELRQLCQQFRQVSMAKQFPEQSAKLNGTDAVSEARRLREERKRIKQEIKDKAAAIRVQERNEKAHQLHAKPMVESTSTSSSNPDMSLADMLDSPPLPSSSSFTSPTKEQSKETLKSQRDTLKAQAKALKEEERERKEALKLVKLRAAVQARNDKIDAVRSKAAQKAAQKAASRSGGGGGILPWLHSSPVNATTALREAVPV